jgi:hypothetical protein
MRDDSDSFTPTCGHHGGKPGLPRWAGRVVASALGQQQATIGRQSVIRSFEPLSSPFRAHQKPFSFSGTPTRYPAATLSGTPVDNRSPTSTAARLRSRRGKRTCSRKTRRDGSPSTSPGCRSCLGRRSATDSAGQKRRSPMPEYVAGLCRHARQ